MDHDSIKHDHHDNDIIIKDQDGTYKILKDGKFVALDEAEAKEHGLKVEQKKSQSAPAKQSQPEQPKVDPNLTKAQEQLKKSGTTFPSNELKKRAERALISHYKKVRKPFEVKETLMKSPQQGGVGLDEKDANKLLGMKSTNEASPAKQMQQVKQKPLEPKSASVKPMPQKKVGGELSKPAKLDLKSNKEQSMPSMAPKKKSVMPSKPATVPKPAVSDVQKPSMPTVGLAGELNYKLVDWRRIAPNPKDRVKKIENQLGVLEQEAYPKRIQGLMAWRNSEVMNLYIDAGKQAIETEKTVKDILSDGSATGLSHQEWEAIAELNRRIRT